MTKYINGTYKKLSFKGAMSYYPLIDDEGQLKELDRWLIKTIINTLRLRQTLWMTHNYNVATYFPFTLTIMNIIEECKNKNINEKIGLVRIPSFLSIYKAIKLGIINEGILNTMNPKVLNSGY